MRKPKAPKKPKTSASLTTWENYHKRYADYKKRVNAIEAAARKKKALIDKARKMS